MSFQTEIFSKNDLSVQFSRIIIPKLCGINIKALAVIFAQTMSFDSSTMFGSTITLIVVPAIHLILWMQAYHIFIPVGLSQYAGGGNRGIHAISLNYTIMRNVIVRFEAVAINQQNIGLAFKFI
jgi:hypothetical protein